MAQNKKSIIVYADWGSTFDELEDEEAGQLIKHFFDYIRDKNPTPKNKLIKIAFEPIKQNLKRDLEKWDLIKEKRSKAGKISAERRSEQTQTNSTHVESVQHNSTNPTVNVNDNVNDNVNVNVNDNDIKDKSFKIDFNYLLNFYNQTFEKKCTVVSAKVQNAFKARIKEKYTIENILKSIENVKKDNFHVGNSFLYATLEYFSRSATIDKYAFSEINQKLNYTSFFWGFHRGV